MGVASVGHYSDTGHITRTQNQESFSFSQHLSRQTGTLHSHIWVVNLCIGKPRNMNNMETLKVYPGIEKGSLEYYYKKYRMHSKRDDPRRPFTLFICMNNEDNFPCMQEYVTLSPGAPPQKYVSIFASSGCEELSANQILAGLQGHLQWWRPWQPSARLGWDGIHLCFVPCQDVLRCRGWARGDLRKLARESDAGNGVRVVLQLFNVLLKQPVHLYRLTDEQKCLIGPFNQRFEEALDSRRDERRIRGFAVAWCDQDEYCQPQPKLDWFYTQERIFDVLFM